MRTVSQSHIPTEKTELKKATPTPLSFAQAATRLQPSPRTAPILPGAVPPGWVYIRRHAGLIQYKYGSTDSARYPCGDTTLDQDAKLGRLLVKYRLANAQYERDNDILRLGDYSEYYNQPTLQEMFAEEALLILQTEARHMEARHMETRHMEARHSDISDIE